MIIWVKYGKCNGNIGNMLFILPTWMKEHHHLCIQIHSTFGRINPICTEKRINLRMFPKLIVKNG